MMMNVLPTLIIVWAIFTGLFLALLAYNSTLSRYEEGQLFLDGNKPGYEESQVTIVGRINKLLPYIRLTGVVSAVMTVLVIAIYTMDAWREIH
jgi:sorbitol-specific phosphotransferase system component IIC